MELTQNTAAENTSDVENSEITGTAAGDAQSSVTSIERPSQSDTVEMLPGTPAQNGLIPKEDTDNAGSSESGTSSPEAGTASGTSDFTTGESGTAGTSTGTSDTTGTTSGATDETGASGNTAASTSGSVDTTGAADTSTDATGTSNGPTGTATETTDTSTETGTDEIKEPDYTLAYDKETKHFNITFNIQDGAEGDQTIELSKVNDAVAKFGESKVDEWLATEDGQKWYNNHIGYWLYEAPESCTVPVDNLEFKVTFSVDEKGYLQRQIVMAPLPGDITTFDITVSNGSKHTYVYKDGSLTVATAKLPENPDPNAVTGFDGQKLPDVIAGNTVAIFYSADPDIHGCMEDLIDKLGFQRNMGVSGVKNAVDRYVMEHYHKDTDPNDDKALSRAYDAYILDYYNTKDHTSYTSVAELLEHNDEALKDLNKTGPKELHTISFDSPTYYNYFYKYVLNLKAGDPAELEKFKNDVGVEWKTKGNDLSIGDYMYDKLNSTEGAWDKANSYFNTLLSKGLTKDEATWAAFALAVNIDGNLCNNNSQNKPLDWYASMVLKQTDGNLKLQKVDEQGNVIGADGKDENQTSFYLWYKDTETDKDGNQQDVTKYCVYTKPQYETVTKPDGTTEQKLVKDGYYGWVDYDPENKKMDYTISTTNGTLNIDYALLEGMVYYMKEKVAPAGYDVDTKIHVLCDEATYQEMSKKVDGKETTEVVNPATGEKSIVTYMGSIKGGETLEVNFVDKKTSSNPGGGSSGGSSSGGGSHSDPSGTPSIAETTPEGQVLGVSRTPAATSTSSPAPVTGRVLGASRRPQTGDESNMHTYGAIFFGGVVLLAAWGVTFKKKKRRANEA